jgi:hypothetical protein
MIEMKAKNESDAKKEAVALSKANPGMYVLVRPLFTTAYAWMSKRLNVFAPTDTPFNWYVLNGKVKQFTNNQIIADQNATPILS